MLPPGPKTPALWQTWRFVTKPREYSRKMVDRYGPAVRFRGLNGDGIAFANAELAREVFAADPDAFETPALTSDLFGAGSLLAASGPTHRRMRKVLNPRFHGARIKAFLTTMQRVVRDHLAAFEDAAMHGRAVVMTDFAQALTLDIILETVFGSRPDLDRAAGRAMLVKLVGTVKPSFASSKILRSHAYPPWRTFQRARAEFDAWVDGLLRTRRNDGDLGTDLLGVLLEARYDDGSPMQDAEIRDQLMTTLFAGHETTAVTLAWAVYWVLRHPEVLTRLRRDVDALGASAPPEALVRLPYVGAVVSETLRIEPVVTDVPRQCREPLRVGPWTVPAGEMAVVNLVAILSDPALFPEPERFDPARFLDATFTASQFVPFGGGARRCLGSAFAESELAIALGAIVCAWDLALESDAPERAVRRNITMGPERGVRIRVAGPRRADIGVDALSA
jgi:cytochrome P450